MVQYLEQQQIQKPLFNSLLSQKEIKIIDKLIDTLFQTQGVDILVIMMTNKKLIGLRDPYGIRPLVPRKVKNSHVCIGNLCVRHCGCKIC